MGRCDQREGREGEGGGVIREGKGRVMREKCGGDDIEGVKDEVVVVGVRERLGVDWRGGIPKMREKGKGGRW